MKQLSHLPKTREDDVVGGVEELDGVGLSTEAAGFHKDPDTEVPEGDESGDGGGDEVHDVGKTTAPESFTKRRPLSFQVVRRWKATKMPRILVHDRFGGSGRDRLPDNGLANLGGNEERNTGPRQ